MTGGPLLGLPEGAFSLAGQTALVTGASRNIGASLSAALAESGADVVMVARNAERLTAMAERVAAHSPERLIRTRTADVGNRDSVDELIAWIVAEIGDVDIVVNNAAAIATTTDVPILEVSDEAWDLVYETNLMGPFRLIRGLAGPIVAGGRTGSVVNVLSGAGFQPVKNQSPYGSMKAALWMLTRYLAADLAPAVRVNAVVPGVVSSTGKPRSPAQAAVVEAAVPFGRVGRPEEVTGAVIYLCSPAASYTSGEVIFCNGARAW
jgi:NAD(P)-dependent dehydrogenase (short-subunit alcohol dehydrogenase family)